jgi:predicted alpha/beta superfamily hydrolase
VTIANSYKRTLTSKTNRVTYSLSVYLPRGYNPEKKDRFPVLYVIPDNPFGPVIAQLTRALSVGDIPRLIVVGVDFTTDNDYYMDLAAAGHDSHWDVPEDRGAANFLRILLQEIKPYIDANFPTDPSDTGIAGHSLAGYFALYSLLHAPQSFQHVYASSPSIVWQDFQLVRDEVALARVTSDIPARVYMDVGELEQQEIKYEELSRNIQSRNYPSMRWQFHRALGQTHQTLTYVDGIDALYGIYGPELRRPSTTELTSLAGTYQMGNGETFRLQPEDGRLYAIGFRSDTPNQRIEWLTTKENEWFIRYLWYRIVVRNGQDGVTLSIYPHGTPGPNGQSHDQLITAKRVRP